MRDHLLILAAFLKNSMLRRLKVSVTFPVLLQRELIGRRKKVPYWPQLADDLAVIVGVVIPLPAHTPSVLFASSPRR